MCDLGAQVLDANSHVITHPPSLPYLLTIPTIFEYIKHREKWKRICAVCILNMTAVLEKQMTM